VHELCAAYALSVLYISCCHVRAACSLRRWRVVLVTLLRCSRSHTTCHSLRAPACGAPTPQLPTLNQDARHPAPTSEKGGWGSLEVCRSTPGILVRVLHETRCALRLTVDASPAVRHDTSILRPPALYKALTV
jgi:hypothetical protein